ncbi:hypothetical protein HY449_02770 [Candidatus Pacearchaeota archaeon]|nr:hypothetical protein [Candidatus Pacearchaeota archaeon]
MALKLSRTIKSAAVGLALYVAGIETLNYLVDFPMRSEIESQEELDRIVNSEATKLGLDQKKFRVKFVAPKFSKHSENQNFDRSRLEDPRVYSMILPQGDELNAAHVRSRLYQYRSNLSEKEKTKEVSGVIYFYFVRKPRADIYALLGY